MFLVEWSLFFISIIFINFSYNKENCSKSYGIDGKESSCQTEKINLAAVVENVIQKQSSAVKYGLSFEKNQLSCKVDRFV